MKRTLGFSLVGLSGGDSTRVKGGESDLMAVRLSPTSGLGGVYTLWPNGGGEGVEHDLSFEGTLAIGSDLDWSSTGSTSRTVSILEFSVVLSILPDCLRCSTTGEEFINFMVFARS
jgi:hypothetical protein